MPHARSVSAAIFVGIGSRHESAEIGGVSHFIEHMMFKGTSRRPAPRDISVAVESVGGMLNAEAGKEATVFWAKVPATFLPLALDVLSDIVIHSRFAPEDIETEKRVVLEELSMLADSPSDMVDAQFDQSLWGNHPMGREIAGTRETVLSFDRDTLKSFAGAHFGPASVVLSVAGPFTADEVASVADHALASWQQEVVSPNLTMCQPTPGPVLTVESKRTEQAHLCLGVPGYSYSNPDRFASDLLSVVLGEGMSSRLFQEIREKRGLAYDVHSSVQHYADVGLLEIYAGCEPRRLPQAMDAILEQLRSLKAGVSEEDLRVAKEMMKGRLTIRMEDTGSVSSWTGGQELLLNRVLTVEEVMRAVDSVSVDDLLRVANETLTTEQLHASVVGPLRAREVDRLRTRLVL